MGISYNVGLCTSLIFPADPCPTSSRAHTSFVCIETDLLIKNKNSLVGKVCRTLRSGLEKPGR
jgi:hypothetical protein